MIWWALGAICALLLTGAALVVLASSVIVGALADHTGELPEFPTE
jgi:hypothetical protein